jgi:hypothetical protein
MRVFTEEAKMRLVEVVRNAPKDVRPVLILALKRLEEQLEEAKNRTPETMEVIGTLNSEHWGKGGKDWMYS